MMKLDELLNIARAATDYDFSIEDCYLFVDRSPEHYAYDMPKDLRDFFAAFNPRLIEKMIAEIKAAREIIESEDKHIRHYCHQPYVETYDKAREALDAELGAV